MYCRRRQRYICFYYVYMSWMQWQCEVYDRYICEHFVWPCSWSFVRLFWVMDENYGQFIHNNALCLNQHHLSRLIYAHAEETNEIGVYVLIGNIYRTNKRDDGSLIHMTWFGSTYLFIIYAVAIYIFLLNFNDISFEICR